jgi:hypothetical protein
MFFFLGVGGAGGPAEKIQVSLQSDKNSCTLCEDQYTFWSYLTQFFLEWELFQTKVVKKVKTHFIFSNFFFKKLCHWWNSVEEYSRAGQVTDGGCTLHAGYLRLQTHTFAICNTCCSSTATVVHKCTSLLCDTYSACFVVKIKLAEREMGVKYLLIVH